MAFYSFQDKVLQISLSTMACETVWSGCPSLLCVPTTLAFFPSLFAMLPLFWGTLNIPSHLTSAYSCVRAQLKYRFSGKTPLIPWLRSEGSQHPCSSALEHLSLSLYIQQEDYLINGSFLYQTVFTLHSAYLHCLAMCLGENRSLINISQFINCGEVFLIF